MLTGSRLFRCGVLALGLSSCAQGEATRAAPPPAASAPAWAEPPNLHKVRFVPVAKGVELEALDWGGAGPPVVFLAGLGGTAHVFDEFAPALADRFHVYGVTRRGNGRSSVPDAGYDLPTLVLDLLHALDGLGLGRVSLVGHSAAGEELTSFAGDHPGRVDRLVYLDAAYDRSDPSSRPGADCSNVEPPVEGDLASPASFGAWFERSRGVRLPEGEVHMLFDHHGPPEAAFHEYMKSLRRPDYSRVRAPALAFYAVPASAADFYPAWARMDEPARAKARACFEREQKAVGEA
ncbi:MAG TPA: alpha/beta hydrolase, partial [Polyangiaceae bacterium]|nr:alpha/beta hydrolase [Polyangiaceae bacterium]